MPCTSRLFTSTLRAGSGRNAADDLAAETFLTAFRRRHRFDPARGAVRPWLFGIATNLVARHRRAESRWYAALARAGSDPLVAPAARPSDEDRIADRVAASRPARCSLRRSPGSPTETVTCCSWSRLAGSATPRWASRSASRKGPLAPG